MLNTSQNLNKVYQEKARFDKLFKNIGLTRGKKQREKSSELSIMLTLIISIECSILIA